jgi:hypothetical protein
MHPANEKPSRGYIIFTLAIVALTLFYRKSDALLNPQFWAEDGTVFFLGDIVWGPGAIFASHAGYLQLMLRLLAFLAGWLPFEWQPAAYNYFSLVITLAVAAKLFSPRLRLPHRFLLAAAIPLATHTGEILLCLTNLQWIAFLLLILLLLQDAPKTTAEASGDLVILCLVGLTGPHIIYLLPLFLVRVALRGWHKWDVFHAVIAGGLAAIQIGFVRQSATSHLEWQPVSEWLRVFAWNPIACLLFGWEIGSYVPPIIAAILLCGVVGVVIWFARQSSDRLFPVSMILGAGALALGSTAYRFITNPQFFAGVGAGERYFFFPRLALVWSLILCLDGDLRRRKVVLSILVLAFFAAIADFPVGRLPDLRWKEQVAKVRRGEAETITINPVGWEPIPMRVDNH